MLKLDGISVYYGVIPAVRDLSMSVGKGEINAIIGANGAGKTTTLKTIIGALSPREGKIYFQDRDITHTSSSERVKSGMVLVPEAGRLFSRLTAKENLKLGAYHRTDDQGIKKDMEWIYSLFPRLEERKSQRAGTLSGGEQQMLAIGRGLMAGGELILLDEPSLGLAPKLVQTVYRAITKINKSGMTVLLVEQDTSMALKVSEYLYVLQTGELRLEGKPEEVQEQENIQEAYLGS